MNTRKVYEIIRAFPFTYVDSGSPVAGYRVEAKWVEYDEPVVIDVPTMDKDTINNRLLSLYRQRVQLDGLGFVEEEE